MGEQANRQMKAVHALRPQDGNTMRETVCGASFGFPAPGGFRAFGTADRKLILAVDFGEVTCKRCAKVQRETVQ